MKKGLFIFAIIFVIATVGYMSFDKTQKLQQQGFESTVNRLAGQVQQMGAAVNERRSVWPGDTAEANTAYTAGTGIINAAGVSAKGGIILLNIKTPVRQGETGSLSIQGEPAVRYTVNAVYRKSGMTYTSTVGKSAGTDGIVTWAWDVSRDTTPGSYNLTRTGGGKVLRTSYTVTR